MLTFNTDSLHYKLALLGGLNKYDGYSNICKYTRQVLLGVLATLFGALIVAFMGTVVFNMIFGIIFSIIYGTIILTEAAIAGFIVLVAGAIWFSIWTLLNYNENRERSNKPKKPDGFVKHAYKSWKEQYCVNIEFTAPK